MSDEREKLKGEPDFEAHKLKLGADESDFQAHKLKETEEPESGADDAGDDFEAHKLKQ